MSSSTTSLRDPGQLAARAFPAGSRRWSSFAGIPHGARPTPLTRLDTMRKARQLVLVNAHARSAQDTWASSLVGTGIKPQAVHPDPAVREMLNVGFEAQTDAADHEGRTDFYGLQALVAALVVRDGEAFVRLLTDDNGELRLQVLDADMVDDSLTQELAGGGYILQGIEFDAAGRRVAFHVRTEAPDHPFMPTLDTVRVPAEDMVQVMRVDAPGQVRGLSWFAPVLQRLGDLDAAVDAQLVRQKVAALLTGFITDATGQGEPFGDTTPANGVIDASLEPGEMRVLAAGQSVDFSEPARVGAEVIDFLKVARREIAAGLGLTSHLLDGDLSDANYSSLRAGLITFRRKVEALQWSVIVHQFLRPVWARWITLEMLTGRLPIDALRRPGDWRATWVTPRHDWVDPAKDVAAEISAIEAGLMSRREAVASRGLDIEQLDQDIARDREREGRLGLDFTGRTKGE